MRFMNKALIKEKKNMSEKDCKEFLEAARRYFFGELI